MKGFEPSLWDDSDPLYAPGLNRKPSGYTFWRCPRRIKAAGFSLDNVALPTDPVDAAARCRELTREAVRWVESRGEAPKETVKWLIGRYMTDEFSEFRALKENSKQDYRESMAYWEDAIGHLAVTDLTYEKIKLLEAGMKKNGRSIAFIHRKFTMLRILVKHGKLIKAKGAAEARDILSEIRFQSPPARTVRPTRRQIYRIAIKAWRDGARSFAVGIMIQFELTLRAVDVRGQWLPAGKNPTGLVREGQRWQDGLTWAMFGKDHWSFEKVISKTIRSLPEPITFDLTALPRLREAILSLAPPENRIGPVILSERTKLPYTRSGWAQAWARYRKEARVPDEVQMRDTRAGAITEAEDMGASREQTSQAAQHQKLETTARYSRNRAKRVAEVIDIRQRRQK